MAPQLGDGVTRQPAIRTPPPPPPPQQQPPSSSTTMTSRHASLTTPPSLPPIPRPCHSAPTLSTPSPRSTSPQRPVGATAATAAVAAAAVPPNNMTQSRPSPLAYGAVRSSTSRAEQHGISGGGGSDGDSSSNGAAAGVSGDARSSGSGGGGGGPVYDNAVPAAGALGGPLHHAVDRHHHTVIILNCGGDTDSGSGEMRQRMEAAGDHRQRLNAHDCVRAMQPTTQLQNAVQPAAAAAAVVSSESSESSERSKGSEIGAISMTTPPPLPSAHLHHIPGHHSPPLPTPSSSTPAAPASAASLKPRTRPLNVRGTLHVVPRWLPVGTASASGNSLVLYHAPSRRPSAALATSSRRMNAAALWYSVCCWPLHALTHGSVRVALMAAAATAAAAPLILAALLLVYGMLPDVRISPAKRHDVGAGVVQPDSYGIRAQMVPPGGRGGRGPWPDVLSGGGGGGNVGGGDHGSSVGHTLSDHASGKLPTAAAPTWPPYSVFPVQTKSRAAWPPADAEEGATTTAAAGPAEASALIVKTANSDGTAKGTGTHNGVVGADTSLSEQEDHEGGDDTGGLTAAAEAAADSAPSAGSLTVAPIAVVSGKDTHDAILTPGADTAAGIAAALVGTVPSVNKVPTQAQPQRRRRQVGPARPLSNPLPPAPPVGFLTEVRVPLADLSSPPVPLRSALDVRRWKALPLRLPPPPPTTTPTTTPLQPLDLQAGATRLEPQAPLWRRQQGPQQGTAAPPVTAPPPKPFAYRGTGEVREVATAAAGEVDSGLIGKAEQYEFVQYGDFTTGDGAMEEMQEVADGGSHEGYGGGGDGDGGGGAFATDFNSLGRCPAYGPRVRVLVAVISRCCDEESSNKRAAIRASWGAQLRSRLGDCMDLMFVLAQPPPSEMNAAVVVLRREMEVWGEKVGGFAGAAAAGGGEDGRGGGGGGSGDGGGIGPQGGDLVFVPGLDTYRNLPSKTLRVLQLALSSPRAYTHIVKCDDDVYLRPHKLLYDVILAHRTTVTVASGKRGMPPSSTAKALTKTMKTGGEVEAGEHVAGKEAEKEAEKEVGREAEKVAAAEREKQKKAESEKEAEAALSLLAEDATVPYDRAATEAPEKEAAATGEQLFCGGVSGWFSHADDGFLPVRDTLSKWYLSPTELSDEQAPLGVPYPVGWSYVMSRDVAELALAKAVRYSRDPSSAPLWWGRLPWEDVTMGALMWGEVPLRSHPGFKHPFMSCGADTVAKHLDNLAPALQRSLYEAEMAGAWSGGVGTGGGGGAGGGRRVMGDCTGGEFEPDNFTDWRRWRNEQPDVVVTGRI